MFFLYPHSKTHFYKQIFINITINNMKTSNLLCLFGKNWIQMLQTRLQAINL